MPEVSEQYSASGKMVPVDAGPLPAMIVLRACLRGLGLRSVVESETIKTWHPTITGGFNYGTRLLVPSGHATEVRKAITELRRSAVQATETTDDNNGSEEIVEMLGLRIRWSAVLGWVAPVGLYHALSYVPRARRMSPRPRGHTLTLCGIVLCLIDSVALLGVIVFAIL